MAQVISDEQTAGQQARPEAVGRIVQITGPVVDVEFEEGQTPEILRCPRGRPGWTEQPLRR